MIMAGFDLPPENPSAPKFDLRKTYATAGIAQWASEENIGLAYFLRRYHYGNWRDLYEEDKPAAGSFPATRSAGGNST